MKTLLHTTPFTWLVRLHPVATHVILYLPLIICLLPHFTVDCALAIATAHDSMDVPCFRFLFSFLFSGLSFAPDRKTIPPRRGP